MLSRDRCRRGGCLRSGCETSPDADRGDVGADIGFVAEQDDVGNQMAGNNWREIRETPLCSLGAPNADRVTGLLAKLCVLLG